MVSIAPNQFKIEGTVRAIRTDGQLPDFTTLLVQLEKVECLNGPADFLDASSKEVEVSVPEALAASIKKGVHIACKIRKAPGHFFVLPDSLEVGKEK